MKKLLGVGLVLAMLAVLAGCAALEERQNQLQPTMQDFMPHLDEVRAFLGALELEIDEANIEFHGSFVMVQGSYIGENDVHFVSQYYRDFRGETQWRLMEYSIQWVRGPGRLDAGRGRWQWEQDLLFTEPFTMQRYTYLDIPGPYEVVDIVIFPEDWQAQVIEHMGLADIWYEETRLVVDLAPASVVRFNWGSTGSAILGNNLLKSLATMPNVTEIVVLVGGQRGISADHFSFAEVFHVN